MEQGSKKQVFFFRYAFYPLAFPGIFILTHGILLYLAKLPEDYCYFHTNDATWLQRLFLSNMGSGIKVGE